MTKKKTKAKSKLTHVLFDYISGDAIEIYDNKIKESIISYLDNLDWSSEEELGYFNNNIDVYEVKKKIYVTAISRRADVILEG